MITGCLFAKTINDQFIRAERAVSALVRITSLIASSHNRVLCDAPRSASLVDYAAKPRRSGRPCIFTFPTIFDCRNTARRHVTCCTCGVTLSNRLCLASVFRSRSIKKGRTSNSTRILPSTDVRKAPLENQVAPQPNAGARGAKI